MLLSFEDDKWWYCLPVHANRVNLTHPLPIAVNRLKVDDIASQYHYFRAKSEPYSKARLIYVPGIKFCDIILSSSISIVGKEPLYQARIIISKGSFLFN